MRKAIDRTGQRYGHLLVNKQVPDPNGKTKAAYWECKCDCGSIVPVQANNLRSGTTRSCGCAKLENKNNWKRRSGLSMTEEGNFSLLCKSYERNAKNSNREFSLSYKEFKSLVKDSCYYCGCPPSSKFNNRSRNKKSSPSIYNGIDRKDNNLGYISGNCLTSCYICNRAKQSMSYEDFLVWLDRLSQFQKRVEIKII